MGEYVQSGRKARKGILVALLALGVNTIGISTVWAETFNSTPTRTIGPYTSGQSIPQPVGGWTAADDRVIGASIAGQNGWTSSATQPTHLDDEIVAGGGRNGGDAWRLSNWYHDGIVNHFVSPAFAPVGETGALTASSQSPQSNHATYQFWFRSASTAAEPGTSVSTTISDAPGRRMTYLGIFDARPGDADSGCPDISVGCFHVDVADVVADTDPSDPDNPLFADHYSNPLVRGAWYRAVVDATFVDGPGNDQVHSEIFDSNGASVFAVDTQSWERAYFNGYYGSTAGDRVASDHVAFRVSGNPDAGDQSDGNSYSVTNRPHGIVFDDMSVTPGAGAGFDSGFESDRYVAPGGNDGGGNTCANPASPCQTIVYAISQAQAYNTIHVASGTYAPASALSVTLEGLKIVGDPINKPVIARLAGSINQQLLVINGARNVRIENLDFHVDQTFVAEAIIANGFVDGLAIVNNMFEQSRSGAATSAFKYLNVISVNLDGLHNSAGLARTDGSSVTISGNVINGIAGAAAARTGIAVDGSVGTISNNTITGGTHDVVMRFASTVTGSSGTTVSINGNQLNGRGLEFDAPNASSGAVTISNNVFNAPAFASSCTAADCSLLMLRSNQQNIATTLAGNTFSGHANAYRGLLIENYPGVNLVGNTFTPANGANDFVSLVVSNKQIDSANPANPPYPISINATGNTFNGSGVAGAGRAVELLDDNDANGSAVFGSLLFGGAGAGQANAFDGNLRWYFHLDDYSCDTAPPSGAACTFLDYNGAIGNTGNTQVRPFSGLVNALQNTYAGQLPADMNPSQRNALTAHTYDRIANPALGIVDYNASATQAMIYVASSFAGSSYGDPKTFTHGSTGTLTVYYGINAFATIADGVTYVQPDGQVYVAKGSYSAGATVAKSLQLIGDGSADANPANSTVVSATITLSASGSSASPLMLQNLRISGVSGDGIALSGSQSYITLDGVASVGNTGNGFFVSGAATTTQFLTVTNSHFDGNGHFPPQFNGDLVAGFNFGENASGLDVAISHSTFDDNNGAGLVVNHIGSASSVSTIQRWTIDSSDFSRNIPLDPADPNFYTAGGGLWLKTGAPGSVIDHVTVSGSTFADNGTGQTNTFPSQPPRKINANGINLRARPNTTLSNVRLCDNTFSETPTPGTQLYGIYIFDDTLTSNHGYQPVEICGTTTVNNLAEGVSGYEQFAKNGNEPVVNITGTFNVSGGGDAWNYIQLATTRAAVYVDDGFAANHNGDAVTFTHPLTGTVSASFGDNAFATIASALARVSAGGTIYVASGMYAESSGAGQNLSIGKPVTILGERAGINAGVGSTRDPASGESIIVPASAEAALNLSSGGKAVVNIGSDDVVIDGFVIDGDNPALSTGVALNGTDPDVSTGVFAAGNRISLQNLILRNLIYAGIDGYATSSASGGNLIRNNRFTNITSPSTWGIGVLLQDNFYAQVTGNLMDQVRVGVQTNNNSQAAPAAFAPAISGNHIHATRTGIFHNLFYNTASTYAISGNTLIAASNAAQTGGWKGLWIESMGGAQTMTVQNNIVDGSALIASGRITTAYVLNNITSSAAATTAIDGGQVLHVDVGVLATDATGYTGPVNDFLVRNIAFDSIALGAFYTEDTQEQSGSVRLTIGSGNSYVAAAHELVLSGAAPVVAYASGGSVNDVFVRSARTYINGIAGSGPCTPVACTVVNASINAGIAAVSAGGTVAVEDGSFAQNVAVNKQVMLKGAKATIAGYDAARTGSGETIINPATGKPLYITAANATVDGFTFDGAVRDQTVVTNTSAGSNFQFINNRVTNVFGAAGILIAQNTVQWTIAHNLFKDFANDVTAPIRYGQAIKYLKGIGGQIEDNEFVHVQSNALQVEQNSGTINVLSNRVDGQTAYYTNTGLQLDGNSAATVLARDNKFTNTQNGLLIDNGSSTTSVVCNVVTNSQIGLLVLSFPTLGTENAGRIFDNALSGSSADIYSSWSANALVVGSNYYDGAAASTGGSAALIADALPANPIGQLACGDNTPTAIVTYAGTSPQSTPVTMAFSPLHARMQDVLGGAVMGQPIALAANAAGNGASAALGTTSGTGNYNGELISTAQANGIAGSHTVDAASGSLHAAFSLTNTQGTGTVVFDNLSLTYTGSAQTLLAHMPQDGTATCTLTPATVTNAGSYPVSAVCSSANYTASGSATVSVAKATGTITFDNLTYIGSAQTASAHITEEPATACTVTPTTVGPDAGSYPVSASCTGTNYDASGAGVILIAKASSVVTITSADLHQNFGSTHAVGASATPHSASGSSVSVTYDGSPMVPTATGSYAVVATLVDPNYTGSASAVLVIGDAANITLTLQASQAMALVGTHAPYTDPVDYTGTIRNVGAPTAQKVHTVISVVRIDDGNTIGEQPIAIDAADVQACVYDPSGWAAQEPGNHNGCPQDYESLALSQGTGAFNGRPAVTFRYPNLATYDQALPVIDPATAIPASQFSFKRGDYQVHISLVGDDGTVYATAQDGTTVPDASVAYAGATSGQAEDALLSTTTLRNSGGRVASNVIVRVTLSDAAATNATPIPLVSGDADLAYQVGDIYATLPWAGNAADGGLVTYFGPTSGFPLEDGYNATTAGRGIFHREGSYHLRYEVLDAATQAMLFASAQVTIVIGANQVNFALSDLQQVYDGSPRTVSVTPANVPHTTVYEAMTGATCPTTPSGSNTIAPTDAGSYCVYVDATGNYVGSARGTLVIAKASTSVSLDGAIAGTVSRAYDGTAQIVTATPGTAISGMVEVRYNGDLTAPTAAGSYSLVATIVDPNIEGSTTGTLIVAINGGATIVLNDDDGTLDGTIHRAFTGSVVAPVTAMTNPAVAYAVTYVGDGSTVYPLTATPPTAAGQYHVVASTTDANYAPTSASGTLVVDVASATIALDAATLSATYNGQPHAVTATTTPSGLAYTVTYDGSATPPVDAGSYAVTATVTTPSYTGAASGTLVIAPATGVVTFGTTNVTFDGQPHTTTAVISQEPGDTAACVLTATTGDYPRTDAGSTAVSAVCAGSNYSASGTTTLVVSRKPVTITLAELGSFPYDGASHVAIATVNDTVAGFPASADVTYDGGTGAPTNVGTYAVLASLDAASQVNYSATPANGSIVIGSANASVTLANLTQIYDGTDRIVTATTMPADLATSITYDGSVLPPVNAGSYTVVATITEAGYSGSTSGTLVVAKAPATIGLSDLTQAYDGQPKPVTVATTPAGLAIAVSYDGSATAPTAVGTYAVLAIIADPNYTGSTSGTLHIVAAGPDAIAANGTTTFTGTAGQAVQGALPSVRVTDSGGNPVAGTVVTFAAAASNGTLSGATQVTDGNGVATLGGWTLDPTPGTDTVVASAASVTSTVAFIATAAGSTDALAVTITDGRDYARVFSAVTYTITIGNATSSTVSGINVTDALSPELDVNSAHWQCIGINGGTCSASGLGDLSDTASLPAGSSVVYLLSATVVGATSDTIVTTIDASGPNGTVSATDTTAIVLFRNGFEAGGDGAQDVGDPSDVLGLIDAQTTLDLDVEPATLRSLQRVTIASSGAFRIEAIRIDGAVWVRLVARAGAGETASLWSPMTGKRLSLGMEQSIVVLAGAVDALSVAVQAPASLTIRGNH